MKQLFLTSSVHAVAADISKRIELKDHNKLVFIDTPAEPETGDKSWLTDDRQSLIKAGFNVTDYSITQKKHTQLINDLESFDFIYLSGGNTFYLWEQSQKSGFNTLIKQWVETGSKIYIGTSAGSIIAGLKCPDYLLEPEQMNELESVNGYGLVNFTILPHWGSPIFKNQYLEKRLDIAYKVDQVPLILLTDTQYIHVTDDTCQIIDVMNKQ